MKTILSAALILVATLGFSQQRETRKLESFTGISTGQSIKVEIVSGDKEEAIVEVSGAELSDVLTEVWGGELKIRMKDSNFGWRNLSVKVTVTYKTINSIEVSSSSDLVALNTVVSDQLDVEVSSSGEANMDAKVGDLTVRVSSSGDLNITGTAARQDVKVSSSGSYDGNDLRCEFARVNVSSSGDVRIYVTKEIDADASSSGSVTYRGEPEKVYVDSSSSGRVKKA